MINLELIHDNDYWPIYPRHVGKKYSRECFVRWAKIVGSEVIISGLKRNIPIFSSLEFCPHSSTWLNGNRWEDGKPETKIDPLKIREHNIWMVKKGLGIGDIPRQEIESMLTSGEITEHEARNYR